MAVLLTRRSFQLAVAATGIACLANARRSMAAVDAEARADIDSNVDQALAQLYKTVPGSENVARNAAGILVFPSVYKAGIGIGGEYGKGALRVGGKSVAYYNIAGASFGLQLGASARSIALMFMTNEALARFQNSAGWDVGGDASVTLVKVGANGSVDTSTMTSPVLAFTYGNTGLMYDLSLKGTKVTRLDI